MSLIALIDEVAIIQRIRRHLELLEGVVRVGAAPPLKPVTEPWLDDPFPDNDHEPVFA